MFPLTLLKFAEQRVLLGILSNFDYSKYDVDLFLMHHSGELLSLIPKQVNLLPEIPQYSAMMKPMVNVLKQGQLKFVAGTPFCHAPCMVRAEALKKADGYSTNPKTIRDEDYNLWFRLYALGYKGYKMLGLPIKYYIFALRPILVGLLPKKIYMMLHHRKKSQ